MSTTIHISVADRQMVLNPVLATLLCGSVNTYYSIYNNDTNALLYKGAIVSVNYPANNVLTHITVDLSDFLRSYFEKAGVMNLRIKHGQSSDPDSAFTVYGGGISKVLQRRLAVAGTDIFVWKLKNPTANFFLTSRTNNCIITIPEDELLPLSYYAKGFNFAVKVAGEQIAAYDHSADATDSLQTVDFNALRRAYVTSNNKLVNAFDIITSTGGYACTVLITDAVEKHNFFLKFLNNWGVYEKISLTQLVDYTAEFTEAELVAKFDTQINDLVDTPLHKNIKNKFSASIGYRTAEERLFAINGILSNECYLMAYGDEFAVKVTTETSLIGSSMQEPGEIKLTMEMLDSDILFNPILEDSDYNTLTTGISEHITTQGANILI